MYGRVGSAKLLSSCQSNILGLVRRGIPRCFVRHLDILGVREGLKRGAAVAWRLWAPEVTPRNSTTYFLPLTSTVKKEKGSESLTELPSVGKGLFIYPFGRVRRRAILGHVHSRDWSEGGAFASDAVACVSDGLHGKGPVVVQSHWSLLVSGSPPEWFLVFCMSVPVLSGTAGVALFPRHGLFPVFRSPSL